MVKIQAVGRVKKAGYSEYFDDHPELWEKLITRQVIEVPDDVPGNLMGVKIIKDTTEPTIVTEPPKRVRKRRDTETEE